jgi:hypothetical protein
VDFMTNLEFRERRRSGEVQPDTRVYDHLLTRLGDLRAGSFETTVERSWYARIGAGA